jgi:hypothetical protein
VVAVSPLGKLGSVCDDDTFSPIELGCCTFK